MAFTAMTLRADETRFDFSTNGLNLPPAGCFSIVAGGGKPGDWRVIEDMVPLPPTPFSDGKPVSAPKSVIAQLAADPADEHFPMLVLGTNTYGDFKITTRFKLVDGTNEQMAGIAFRMQDAQNYYYVRASGLGKTFYFFKVFKGVRSEPIGNELAVEPRVWHDLSVECQGSQITIKLDGKDALPTLNDLTFAAGKIALWTKSDSVSYFADPVITFTPREKFVQLLVRETFQEHPKLVAIQLMMPPQGQKEVRIAASTRPEEIGGQGEGTDADCIATARNYFRKDKNYSYVTMPLRDRNGDSVAAVRFVMRRDTIQPEETALARAIPILKEMQERASAVETLY